jgi:hypothetical protein
MAVGRALLHQGKNRPSTSGTGLFAAKVPAPQPGAVEAEVRASEERSAPSDEERKPGKSFETVAVPPILSGTAPAFASTTAVRAASVSVPAVERTPGQGARQAQNREQEDEEPSRREGEPRTAARVSALPDPPPDPPARRTWALAEVLHHLGQPPAPPPRLERPGRALRPIPPTPAGLAAEAARDPAEQQAESIGARIGGDLDATLSVAPGPLAEPVRRVAERHLGVDLAGTELRADGPAQELARALDALAVAEGSTVSFAAGRLSGSSLTGRNLLGHELTHVAQQRAHGVPAQQRAGVPANPAPKKIGPEDVRKAMDDGNEELAYKLMRQLDKADADTVLSTMQKLATKCFGNDSIAVATKILVERGGNLVKAVDWMLDEGTSFALLKPVIQASADESQKAALRDPKYMKQFVKAFGNTEMADLVELMRETSANANADTWLEWQLYWMLEEGTSAARILRAVDRAKSDNEKAKVRTPEWSKRFVKELGNDDIKRLVLKLGGGLRYQLSLMGFEGTNFKSIVEVISATPEGPERTKVYGADALGIYIRDLLVRECNASEMEQVVALLGGTLRQQLEWMADKGSNTTLIRKRVEDPKVTDKVSAYDSPRAVALLHAFRDDWLAYFIFKIGGTPDQQMKAYGARPPIERINWATPTADWVAAIMKYRTRPLDMLTLARKNAAAWGPLIRPQLSALFAKDPTARVFDQDRVNVVWAAYDTGATFNAAAIKLIYHALYGKDWLAAGSTKQLGSDTYSFVMPDDDAARRLMNLVRNINRNQVGEADIGFSINYTDSSGAVKSTGSVYFSSGVIVIKVVAGGAAPTGRIPTTAEGTARAVSPALTFFENHVRHEIGHAVGARKWKGMDQSGNDFAMDYGKWATSSAADFRDWLWTTVPAKPAGGWPRIVLSPGTAPVVVTDVQVRDYLVKILSTNAQDTTNPIGANPATIRDKTAVLAASIWGAVPLVQYMNAVAHADPAPPPGAAPAKPADIRDGAYMFPGWVPTTGPIRIYSTRYKDGFASYSLAAYVALRGLTGWYSLSSPAEMFAEMYTHRYARLGPLPSANGKNPDAFFDALEKTDDPQFGKP